VAPRRPWLGAGLQTVTPEIAATLGGDTASGVIVASVADGGPGAAAGLKSGDVIVSIDSDDVDDRGALNYRLATKPLGGTAKLGIVRDGKRYTAVVKLEAAPETPPRDSRLIAGGSPFAGITVLNLSPAVAEELAYDGGSKGVIVAGVAEGSNAAHEGFARGDVIVNINGVAIETTRRLADVLGEPVRYLDLTMLRGGHTIRQRLNG